MANIIKAALALIDNRVTKRNETNNTVYLSDGTQFNKAEFNKRVTVLREFMQYGVNTDEYVDELMRQVQAKSELRKALLTEKNDKIDTEIENLKIYIAGMPKVSNLPKQKEEKVLTKQDMCRTAIVNKRFICGWSYADESRPEFVMIFWRHFKEVGNGHGDLEQYYKKHIDRHFEAKSGGFYLTHEHNDAKRSIPTNVYLFGKSSTFRSFEYEKEDIRKWGAVNGINFIFGKTEFGWGEENDIIAENFTDYVKPAKSEVSEPPALEAEEWEDPDDLPF